MYVRIIKHKAYMFRNVEKENNFYIFFSRQIVIEIILIMGNDKSLCFTATDLADFRFRLSSGNFNP